MVEEDWIKGRGAQLNTHNRYEQFQLDKSNLEGIDDWESLELKTQYIKTFPKTIVNEVKSSDVHMMYSVNPYQGCEHGCTYCYARNSHEYWGYSAGIDFESKILVKENAVSLLEEAFENKSWVPKPISFSGNTDCYQPIERSLQLTRKLLACCLEYRNPITIITKNALILRDLDILTAMAERNLVAVFISITGIDESLRSYLEPRTSTYQRRFKTIEQLSKAGIPCGVMNAPIIPGLNDQEMPKVLQAAAAAGAQKAGYTVVRLNGAIESIFHDWIHQVFPDKADKVWHHIQAAHGGKVSDSRLGTRMRGEGVMMEMIAQQFKLHCKKLGLNNQSFDLDVSQFRRKGNQAQLSLFD